MHYDVYVVTGGIYRDRGVVSGNDFVKKASVVCAFVMILMCLCGAVGNSLSLYIYWGPSFRNRSINLLLAALSASDLFLCILAIPVFSITQIQVYCPGLSHYLSGHILLFAYPVTVMLQSMSVWLLVSITIDRYLAVCHPFQVRMYCTKSRAAVTILLIVLFSIAYNFVRFWEFTLSESSELATFEESIVPLLRGDHLFMLLYQNIATLITQFFLPLSVLGLLNLQASSNSQISMICVARTMLEAGVQR
ncbi:unnamed protein product, partial [Anisakis simplex]|uniref:FMRFamide receptor (inferred by orthology to a D. melanogaster protein) n=1 Tax=Anisakis simplex TaxID=6269 RepID=A0A0M3J6G3_ANISI